MTRQNFGSKFKVLRCAGPATGSATATLTGVGHDLSAFESFSIVATLGAVSGSPTVSTLATRLQHSDSQASGFTDVPVDHFNKVVSATLSAANSTMRLDFAKSSLKRYVRTVSDLTLTGGTTPTAGYNVEIIAGDALIEPVVQ